MYTKIICSADVDKDGLCDSDESAGANGGSISRMVAHGVPGTSPTSTNPCGSNTARTTPSCTNAAVTLALCGSTAPDNFGSAWSGFSDGMTNNCPKVGHKDVYLEIDYMTGHQPDPEALKMVIRAFGNVPNSLIKPSNTASDVFGHAGGVTLHVQATNLKCNNGSSACGFKPSDVFPTHDANTNVFQDSVSSTCTRPGDTVPRSSDDCIDHNDYRHLKEAYFGTAAEHGTVVVCNGSPCNVASPPERTAALTDKLDLKANIYHYMMILHNIGNPTGCGPSGYSEVPGNDMIMALG